MKYKGYVAEVGFDDADRIFVGRLIGVREAGAFHADTVAGLTQAFEETVDHYLEICAGLGQEPAKPYSGKFNVRLQPDLHAAVAAAAARRGVSMNQFVSEALERSV